MPQTSLINFKEWHWKFCVLYQAVHPSQSCYDMKSGFKSIPHTPKLHFRTNFNEVFPENMSAAEWFMRRNMLRRE